MKAAHMRFIQRISCHPRRWRAFTSNTERLSFPASERVSQVPSSPDVWRAMLKWSRVSLVHYFDLETSDHARSGRRVVSRKAPCVRASWEYGKIGSMRGRWRPLRDVRKGRSCSDFAEENMREHDKVHWHARNVNTRAGSNDTRVKTPLTRTRIGFSGDRGGVIVCLR